jgi:hypothetical protein
MLARVEVVHDQAGALGMVPVRQRERARWFSRRATGCRRLLIHSFIHSFVHSSTWECGT